MKILLLGDFSGVHNNLKKGLVKFGVDVKIAADGDGYKNFAFDFRVRPFKNKHFYRLINAFYFLKNRDKFKNYDVVQFINPSVFPPFYYLLGIPQYIKRSNKKLLYYCCGTDPNYFESYKVLDYHPFDKEVKYSVLYFKYFKWFINNIDSIIPSAYDYYIGYKNNSVVQPPIALPGSEDVSASVKKIQNKVKILFGITRRSFKGASYIEEALNAIKEKYSNRVEIIIVERLPFSEYKEYLKDSDILIDQCRSYSYGMNALFALQHGVIVLSGAEKKAIDYLGISDSPVINIKPNTQQIYNAIETLINKTNDELLEMKFKSIDYVKSIHGQDYISQEFIKRYKQLLS